MKTIILTIIPFILYANSPFETPKGQMFNMSVFNTKKTLENKKAMKNKKIKCRIVCDKRIYKEQKIAAAISYYKKAR